MYEEDKYALMLGDEKKKSVVQKVSTLFEDGKSVLASQKEQEKSISQMVSAMKQAKVNTFLHDAFHLVGKASVALTAIDQVCKYSFKLIKKGNTYELLKDKDSGEPLILTRDPKTKKFSKPVPMSAVIGKTTEAEKKAQHSFQKDVDRRLGGLEKQMASLQMQNIMIMQQLMAMTEVLDEIRERVVELKEIYDDDLLGSILGMRDQISQIRSVELDENQRLLLNNAITTLNEARGKVIRHILRTVGNLPDVPKSKIGAYAKMLMHGEYADELINASDEVEKYFSMYLLATQLLGYAYAFLGEVKAYEKVFMPDREMMDNPNFEKLIRADIYFADHREDSWYRKPDKYLLKVSEETKRIFIDSEDYMQIEFTGAQLLEAFNG